MLVYFLAQALSYDITGPGYYSRNIYYDSSETFKFDITPSNQGNYYIVFTSKPDSLKFDSNIISNRVYKISKLSASYTVSVSSNADVSFGLFLVPYSYNSLEFWIQPYGSSSKYVIPSYQYSTSQTYI